MNSEKGAISVLILFLLGVWLAIPSQVSLAEMIVEIIIGAMEPGSLGYQTAQNVVWALRIIGIFIVIGIIAYIVQKFRAKEYL